jgi:hypothetical protein
MLRSKEKDRRWKIEISPAGVSFSLRTEHLLYVTQPQHKCFLFAPQQCHQATFPKPQPENGPVSRIRQAAMNKGSSFPFETKMTTNHIPRQSNYQMEGFECVCRNQLTNKEKAHIKIRINKLQVPLFFLKGHA